MNKHVEEAMKLRNATPMCNNCAQTILRVYAEEMWMSEDLAAAVGSNFGSGMRCGGTCGAITAALMVLGATGISGIPPENGRKPRRNDRLRGPFARQCRKRRREKDALRQYDQRIHRGYGRSHESGIMDANSEKIVK